MAGVSLTVPLRFELVVRVLVVVPSLDVIVTDVELAACQVSVTVCPEEMDALFAVRVTVGAAGIVAFGLLAQEEKPKSAASRAPHEIQRYI